MDRRKLAVLGGFFVVAALAIRRRRRRGAVEITIDEPRTGERSTEDEGASDEPGDETPRVELESVEGIGSAYAERLREAGVEDAADLAAADPGTLATETGIGERRIRGWIERIGERDHA